MFDIEIIDQKTQWVNLVKKVKEMTDEKGNVSEIGLFEDVGLISIAKENEFGDPPRRARPWPIPERSFLRFVFDRDLDENTELLFKGVDEILLDIKNRFQVLNEIGIKVTNSIKEFILSGYYKFNNPNHPITIRRKGHDHPLIESGKIVSTITYRVGRGNPKKSGKTIIAER
jgi:hypothetical protein